MNLKGKIQKTKGITLIALVVTIIVLLLLAGISISMLTGQNGILNRAAEAKSKTETSQKEELDKMAKMEAMTQAVDTPVTNPESYGSNPKAQATADGAGKYFAKTDGATYVEGTVDTGVVVNIKGSEFVWVPVEDVVLDATMEENLPKAEGEWSNNTSRTPMAVKLGESYKGILYNYSENGASLKYPNGDNYQGDDTGCVEPSLSYYYQDVNNMYGLTATGLQNEYDNMIESVKKYKGFYVARYEAGIENGNVVFKNAKKNASTVQTLDASENSGNTWYGLYGKMKSFTTENDNVVSSMIWGSQYDAMLNWMLRNKQEVYGNDKRYNSTTITGEEEKDRINNIYDLWGCHYEFTLTAFRDDFRVTRGGYSKGNYGGNYCYPCWSNICAPWDAYKDASLETSSRATLWIK